MSKNHRRHLRPIQPGGEARSAERFGDLATQVQEATGGPPDPILSRSPVLPQARVCKSATQTIATGVLTALVFQSVRWDYPVGGTLHYAGGQPTRLTCHTPGLYGFTGQVYWNGNGAYERFIEVRIGPAGRRIAFQDQQGAIADPTSSLHTEWRMAVGDYAELFVYQTSGANLGCGGAGGAAGNEYYSDFGMSFISP